MDYTRILEIPSKEIKEIQSFLDSTGDGTLNTVRTYIIDFGYAGNGNIQVDIKVCDGEGNPYIDSVIFQDNEEIKCLEVTDTLIGKYIFSEIEGNTYIVIIKELTN